MRKNILIGVSISAIVLLVLSSLTNVVGYQVVQSSNQKSIKDDIDQKEFLFQTIDVSKIHSKLERLQVSDFPCDCEKDNTTNRIKPLKCYLVLALIYLVMFLFAIFKTENLEKLYNKLFIYYDLNCL